MKFSIYLNRRVFVMSLFALPRRHIFSCRCSFYFHSQGHAALEPFIYAVVSEYDLTGKHVTEDEIKLNYSLVVCIY